MPMPETGRAGAHGLRADAKQGTRTTDTSVQNNYMQTKANTNTCTWQLQAETTRHMDGPHPSHVPHSLASPRACTDITPLNPYYYYYIHTLHSQAV